MAKKKKSKKSGVNQKKNHNHAKKKMAVKDFSNAKNYVKETEAVLNEVDSNVMPKKETEKIAKAESKKAEAVLEKAEAELDKTETTSEKAEAEFPDRSKKQKTKNQAKIRCRFGQKS